MRITLTVVIETDEPHADDRLIALAKRRATAQGGDPAMIRTVAAAFVELFEFIDDADIPLADAGFAVLSIEAAETLPG